MHALDKVLAGQAHVVGALAAPEQLGGDDKVCRKGAIVRYSERRTTRASRRAGAHTRTRILTPHAHACTHADMHAYSAVAGLAEVCVSQHLLDLLHPARFSTRPMISSASPLRYTSALSKKFCRAREGCGGGGRCKTWIVGCHSARSA